MSSVAGMVEWCRTTWRVVRGLFRAPAYALFAAASLALATGSTIAVYSVVDRVVVGQQPWPDPASLRFLERQAVGSDVTESAWSLPRIRELQRLPHPSLIAIAAASPTPVTVRSPNAGVAEGLRAELVSPEYFPTLGIAPLQGRLSVAEAGGDPFVVVISEALYAERYGRQATAVGATLAVNGVAMTIVGVAPAGFRGVTGGVDVWIPVAAAAAVTGNPDAVGDTYWAYRAIVRTRAGIPAAAIRSELARMSRESGLSSAAHGAGNLVVVPPNEAAVDARLRRVLAILLGAAACVLLLACANVASLSVVRTLSLRRDVATRVALGAAPAAVAGRFMTEAATLALLGTAGGLLVARWMVSVLWAARPVTGRWVRVLATLDVPSLGSHTAIAAAAIAAIVTGVVGAWPLLEISRVTRRGGALSDIARSAAVSPRAVSVRRWLVGLQMALSFVLAYGAAVFVSASLDVPSGHFGVAPDHVTVGRLELPRARYDAAQTAAFYAGMLDRLSRIPGVEAASVDNTLPLGNDAEETSVAADTREGAAPVAARRARYHQVGPAHFRALGTRILQGRTLRNQPAAERVIEVVVSQTAARRLWDGRSALGQFIRMAPLGSGGWRTAAVVGVVEDVQYALPGTPPDADVYVAASADPPASAVVVVRSRSSMATAAGGIARVVQEVDPEVVLSHVQPMDQWFADTLSSTRFLSLVLVLYGGLALGIALVGVYSVGAYEVLLRRKTFAIMMALGAPARTVTGGVLRGALRIAVPAVTVGVLASAMAGRVLRSQLYGANSIDVRILLVCAAAFSLASLVGVALPAWTAAHVDPADALAVD